MVENGNTAGLRAREKAKGRHHGEELKERNAPVEGKEERGRERWGGKREEER